MNLGPASRDRSSLALIGYRGTGKSTVGRIVAHRLGWRFLDTDTLLESTQGQSVASIFQNQGEPAFRDLESTILRGLIDGPPRVIATGGGIVVRPENRTQLKRLGLVVWLTANPDRIAERIGAKAHLRPALTAAGTLDEIGAVLATRTPWYREVADVEVATDGLTAVAVAEAVLSRWGDERSC